MKIRTPFEQKIYDAAYKAAYEKYTAAKGGEGSGNFGHAGRPGEIGGSSDDGGYNSTEQRVLDEYLASAYESVNGYLRNGVIRRDALGNTYSKNKIDRLIEKLDGMMQKTTEDIVVFRGVRDGYDEKDKGYVSTSLNKDVASEFGNVYRVVIPAGSYIIRVAGAEQEIIVGRNTKLKYQK